MTAICICIFSPSCHFHLLYIHPLHPSPSLILDSERDVPRWSHVLPTTRAVIIGAYETKEVEMSWAVTSAMRKKLWKSAKVMKMQIITRTLIQFLNYRSHQYETRQACSAFNSKIEWRCRFMAMNHQYYCCPNPGTIIDSLVRSQLQWGQRFEGSHLLREAPLRH